MPVANTSASTRRPARRASASTTRPRAAAPRVLAAYKKIQFGSRQSVARSLAGPRMAALDIGPLLDAAQRESVTKANQLAVGLVAKKKNVGEERDAIRGMMRWGATRATDADARRRLIVRAYKANQREMFVVHGISELAPDQAALFMRTYFAEGGSMKAVIEWLQIAGKSLQTIQPAPTTNIIIDPAVRIPRPARKATQAAPQKAGFLDIVSDVAGAVGDFVSDAGSAAVNAVTTVVNAVLTAGKSLADAVAAAASWTVSQVTDLVRALVAAGKGVQSILTEALARGSATLKKFVEALAAAGRSVSEMLSWAVARAATVVKDTIAALLSAGKTVYQVIVWAAAAESALALKIVRGLLDAAKTVATIMADVIRLEVALMRKMVTLVFQATQKLADILASIAQSATSIIGTVLEGLLAAGATLAATVASIFTNVAQAFRRGLVEGLMAIGKSALDILKAALFTSAAMLALAFASLMEIFGGHRPLNSAELSAARKVFGWSIDLSRVKIAVASIPADVVNWLNGQRPFTTMYIINFASSAHITMGTLIHELTHVWQGVVAGPVYMVEALHSQFFGRGYEVTAADINAAGGDINKLEREQQAVVVERYYMGKWGGSSWDVATYEPLAKDVYKPMPMTMLPIGTLLPAMLPFRSKAAGRVPRLAIRSYN